MIRKLALVSLMALSTTSVLAGQQTWNFNDGHLSGNNAGNTLDLSSGGVTLEVSAWASTDNGCNNNGQYGNGTGSGDPDPCIRDAKINNFNSYGIGIENRDETYNGYTNAPQHAIDNIKNGGNSNDLDYEMILLTFSEAVNVSGFNIGWTHSDSDLSILAYNGSNQNPDFFNGNTRWADIVGNGTNGGWDLVQESGDVDDYSTLNVSNGTLFSRYWLVGAYNDVFGGTNWSNSNDAFKLKGLATVSHEDTTGPVNSNTPAVLALMGMFLLLMGYRRKA
ncbi:exosortase-dependent surface protein XDP1 [Glaciecola petra]|uniref:Exosortase-dependent surface protein XDP1 n=1 Tax=Glaciecola petra TaxID=3075602 RepID=A0ABU2ZWG6_9ALTE|nr:exosortase-dependent surface protein XDP1 [Aestuariibacter sp. P117]MDT0595762.1 exosortase-dependent surface protein XDP1 [Aestuariibacter sp. P117]